MNSLLEKLISASAISNYARTVNPSGDANPIDELNALNVAQLFDAAAASDSLDHDLVACCCSGLWLLHNFLDRSHAISQEIDSAEGSYWHAIMHRTEGDFSNAKYWYRRAGDHEVLDNISGVAGDSFDPSNFVDQCQHDYGSGRLSDEVHSVAVAEWRALFQFCYDNASYQH